jgi:hypothetical protein
MPDDAGRRLPTIQLSLERNPDPDSGVSGFLFQSFELRLVRELAREIDARMSRSQHLSIDEQAIVQKQVCASVAADGDQWIVLDANGSSEGQFLKEGARGLFSLEVVGAADERRRGAPSTGVGLRRRAAAVAKPQRPPVRAPHAQQPHLPDAGDHDRVSARDFRYRQWPRAGRGLLVRPGYRDHREFEEIAAAFTGVLVG